MKRPDNVRYKSSGQRGTHVYGWIEVAPGEFRWRRFGRVCAKGQAHYIAVTAQGTIGSGHRTRRDAEDWLFSVDEYGIYNGEFAPPDMSVVRATVKA